MIAVTEKRVILPFKISRKFEMFFFDVGPHEMFHFVKQGPEKNVLLFNRHAFRFYPGKIQKIRGKTDQPFDAALAAGNHLSLLSRQSVLNVFVQKGQPHFQSHQRVFDLMGNFRNKNAFQFIHPVQGAIIIHKLFKQPAYHAVAQPISEQTDHNQ